MCPGQGGAGQKAGHGGDADGPRQVASTWLAHEGFPFVHYRSGYGRMLSCVRWRRTR
ncbi:hypothetical protein OF001_U10005 [Pseudomonas sp. OF001]|nr:hypothetical protein OF001_U10005 [Pseudomonas sp. OF001]